MLKFDYEEQYIAENKKRRPFKHTFKGSTSKKKYWSLTPVRVENMGSSCGLNPSDFPSDPSQKYSRTLNCT